MVSELMSMTKGASTLELILNSDKKKLKPAGYGFTKRGKA
jgi:hypothetical protein